MFTFLSHSNKSNRFYAYRVVGLFCFFVISFVKPVCAWEFRDGGLTVIHQITNLTEIHVSNTLISEDEYDPDANSHYVTVIQFFALADNFQTLKEQIEALHPLSKVYENNKDKSFAVTIVYRQCRPIETHSEDSEDPVFNFMEKVHNRFNLTEKSYADCQGYLQESRNKFDELMAQNDWENIENRETPEASAQVSPLSNSPHLIFAFTLEDSDHESSTPAQNLSQDLTSLIGPRTPPRRVQEVRKLKLSPMELLPPLVTPIPTFIPEREFEIIPRSKRKLGFE